MGPSFYFPTPLTPVPPIRGQVSPGSFSLSMEGQGFGLDPQSLSKALAISQTVSDFRSSQISIDSVWQFSFGPRFWSSCCQYIPEIRAKAEISWNVIHTWALLICLRITARIDKHLAVLIFVFHSIADCEQSSMPPATLFSRIRELGWGSRRTNSNDYYYF